ncbi:hypothetical protein RJ639_028026 [Escallonia herrerae]|uniref:Uncharacterized protein n=1 Tax=Escallonia herrerae TaxID=1293975 RepID=A0AA88XAE6_9ASTE|nr:hypothetical protein RJ639_028026 [Escallonia herrerae]
MERSEEALSDSAGLVHPSSTITTNNSADSRGPPQWPTIDGPLGLSEEDSIKYARRYYDTSCLDVVRSAIGFTVFTALLGSWALTFAIGGERLFGHVWDELIWWAFSSAIYRISTSPSAFKSELPAAS